MDAIAKTIAGILVVLVSGAFSLSHDVSPSQAALQANVQQAAQAQSGHDRIIAAPNTSAAYNWAGYVADDGPYSGVSGTWIVPRTLGGAENGADATWVGIGGVSSNDLIQAGTEALPDGRGGSVYSAWFEVLPDDSKIVPLRVQPGDSITISIEQSAPREWKLSFVNNTTGANYNKTVQYDSSLSSAEWIQEMPLSPDTPIALDDFGTVHFTAGYAIKDGEQVTIADSNATPLRMDNDQHEPLAIPSVIGNNGMSFSVVRTEASSLPLQYAHRYQYENQDDTDSSADQWGY